MMILCISISIKSCPFCMNSPMALIGCDMFNTALNFNMIKYALLYILANGEMSFFIQFSKHEMGNVPYFPVPASRESLNPWFKEYQTGSISYSSVPNIMFASGYNFTLKTSEIRRWDSCMLFLKDMHLQKNLLDLVVVPKDTFSFC